MNPHRQSPWSQLLLLQCLLAATTAFVSLPNNHYDIQKTCLSALTPREIEIRRKIAALKKEGRISKNVPENEEEPDDSSFQRTNDRMNEISNAAYTLKIQKKLGKTKSEMLGFDTLDDEDVDDDDVIDDKSEQNEDLTSSSRTARIGALPKSQEEEEVEETFENVVDAAFSSKKPIINPDLFSDIDDEDDDELSEEALLDLVEQKLLQEVGDKRRKEQEELQLQGPSSLAQIEVDRRKKQLREQQQQQRPPQELQRSSSSTQLTTGVGGSWNKNETIEVEYYKPKTGSWGAFPRPKDISKAYGGGRRIGPGFSNEKKAEDSVESTRERLQQYREKMGIDVQSEKDHAAEIDDALRISGYAMQRGMYSTAVSALEKVTKYCSSNSKIGGKVFLELAMAYEAVGRSKEAIIVYKSLSKSRMEDVKYNAKRLLYGLEAMQFMQNNVGSKAFSRQRVRNTFIDTTGLANIAQNFDDVYNTAWIDLDKGFYKRLTESVVRSPREARQILLRAVGAGEVERLRIVQALRSLSRRFDDALEKEISRNAVKVPEQESVAVLDGKPIIVDSSDELSDDLTDLDDFFLPAADQMIENLSGEWRLQLLADRRGDGVKFFNTTRSTQTIDMDRLCFTSAGRGSAFLNVEQSGQISFENEQRILVRREVQVTGGAAVLAGLFAGSRTGAIGAVNTPQQVMSVDSILLITRRAPSESSKSNKADDEKDYFAVWRRVIDGADPLSSIFDDRAPTEMAM